VRVHPHGLGRGALQVAEQGVGGRVGAGQENAEPAKDGREEGEHLPGLGEGQAERGTHAGIVHDVGQAENGGDGQDGVAQLVTSAEQAGQSLAQAVFGHDKGGQEAGKEDGRAGRGDDVEVEGGAIDGLGGADQLVVNDGGGLGHQAVQHRPGELEAVNGRDHGLESHQAPDEDHRGQDDVRAPGAQHRARAVVEGGSLLDGRFIREMPGVLGFP